MKRRKDGRWVRAVSINGKPRYFYSTAETESKAEKDIRRQIAAFQETAINGPLFTEVAEEWRAIHLPTLSVTTLRGYTPAINDAISYFDKKKVKEITTRNVTAYLAYIASQGYAQKTLNNKKIVLNLIMKYAVSQGIIEINPVNDAITPKKLPKKKRRTLTRQEMRLVREHRHDSWCAYFAFFLMSTGLRRGEALALTYGDFQADTKCITINKTTEYVGNHATIKNSPKTDAGIRTVPVNDELADFLSKGEPSELVFSWNGKIIPNHVIGHDWRAWQKEIGLQDVTPHIMRHTYATILYDAGVDVKAAQVILGHANIQTTLDIYTHLSQERSTDAAEKIRAFLSSY